MGVETIKTNQFIIHTAQTNPTVWQILKDSKCVAHFSELDGHTLKDAEAFVERANCRGCNRFSMAEFGQFYEFRSELGWSPDMALFDTDKLNELLKFRPHPVNISPDYEQFQPMVDGHEIFHEHIDHVDDTIPIMLGEYEFINDATGEKRIYHICPDGHHRLAKRIKNKMPIEFYYFNEREMKFCSSTNVLDFLASKGMVIAGISEEEFRKIWHESDPYWKEKNL